MQQRCKYGFDKVKAVYERHAELFGKATPKWNFVVPTIGQLGAEQWPEYAHGMTLGKCDQLVGFAMMIVHLSFIK